MELCGGSQYMLEDYSSWLNDGKLAELEKASQRAKDLQSFGEADRLEFMSRGVAKQALDLEQPGSWEIIQQEMIIQKVFANNAQVEIIEAEDADCHSKTLTMINTTGAVQKEWHTLKPRECRKYCLVHQNPLLAHKGNYLLLLLQTERG